MDFRKKFDEKFLIKKENITRNELTKLLNKMLEKINKSNNDFAIYEHLVWPRYDSFEDIKRGTFINGLYINTISVASTTNVIGNTKIITPEDIINYYYDCGGVNNARTNLGIIVPLTITDEKGRIINFALDKHHPIVPWFEGKRSSILDFLVDFGSSLSNVYSLFNLDIEPMKNDYSYEINTKAIPFLSKEEIREHDLAVAKMVKNALVDRYKILTEEEYDNAKDLNPYIEKLILDEYEKSKHEIYTHPSYWEEP